jgi:hypothetical protein
MARILPQTKWIQRAKGGINYTQQPVNERLYGGCSIGFYRKGKRMVPDLTQLRSIHTIIALGTVGFSAIVIAKTLQEVGIVNPRATNRKWTRARVSRILRLPNNALPHANPLCIEYMLEVAEKILIDNQNDARFVMNHLLKSNVTLPKKAKRFEHNLESASVCGYQYWHLQYQKLGIVRKKVSVL